MEKIFLEIPTINRKQEALDYLVESVKYNSDLNGTGSMDRCLEGVTYEEWLLELEKREDIEYLNQINRCKSKTFFVVREDDNRIVGMINVRYNISDDKLKTWASHIGYGIRPSERRKGYAKIALYLGLLEEQKLGEERILLECTVDNIGSNKTLLALGGILVREEIDPSDGELTKIYHFDVDDCIKNYKELYKNIITNSEDKMKKSI